MRYLLLIIALIFSVSCQSRRYTAHIYKTYARDKIYKVKIAKNGTPHLIYKYSIPGIDKYPIPEINKIKKLKKGYYPGKDISIWAVKIFEKEYKKTIYAKFNGEIITKDTVYQVERIDYLERIPPHIATVKERLILFGETQRIIFLDDNSDYQLIFEQGLFYPEIFGLNIMHVGNIKELRFLSNSPKVKRFSFWLWCPEPDMICSQECYFELINETANEKTDWKSFIENAKLTFVKEGSWIV